MTTPAGIVQRACQAIHVPVVPPSAMVARILAIGLAFTGLVPGGLKGSVPAFSERAKAVIATADSLFLARKGDSALAVLEPLLAESRRRGDRTAELRILVTQAQILATIGRSVPAERAASQAMEMARAARDTLSICRSLRWLVLATQSQGRSEEAIRRARLLLRLATARGDREHEAYARLSLAYGDLLAGRTEEARGGYEQAISLFQGMGNLRFATIARTGLGRSLAGLGEIDGARKCFLLVVDDSRRLQDPFTEAHALNNLGTIEFDHGDPAASAEYFARAYELQVKNGNPEGCISPATNMAMAETYLGRLNDAAETLDRAKRICEDNRYSAELVAVLAQLAFVRKQQGRYVEAADLFRQASAPAPYVSDERRARSLLGLVETLLWMDSTSVAMSVLENRLEPLRNRVSVDVAVQLDRMRGEVLLKEGRTGAALACLRRAEAVAAPRGISFRAGPIALMGRCLERLGQSDSALAVLSRAAHVWEEERSRSRDPDWREQLGVDARLLYTALAEQLLQASGGTHGEAPVRAAFDALQRFKTRTLLERMFGSTGPGRPTVGVDELQRSVLGEGELLVDTFSGTDAVFVFYVDRETCRALRIPGSSGIQERIRSYRRLAIGESGRVTDPDRARLFGRAGRSLSVELLGPAADLMRSKSRILFALDGPLNLIPTGTLVFPDSLSSAGEPTDAGELLLSSAEVVQIPSATVLAELRAPSPSRAPATAPPRLLAVSGREAGGALPIPGAAAEVEWLRRRYRGVQGGTTAGAPADSAKTLDLARYEVLHFAGHTRLDDPAPWRSAITLPSAARGGADSVLRAGAIATMHLSARLAVLSGCESAGGPVTSGEGVLGLTSAFIAAGVPAVIATQWPVNDLLTTRIVQGFYRRLDEGKTVAEALRGAQNAVRGDPRTADPFYWAGFVVVGEGDSRMTLPRRPLLLRGGAYLYLVAACLGLFALDALQRRRSRSRRRESM